MHDIRVPLIEPIESGRSLRGLRWQFLRIGNELLSLRHRLQLLQFQCLMQLHQRQSHLQAISLKSSAVWASVRECLRSLSTPDLGVFSDLPRQIF
jgi:hypothetical protein